MSEKRYFGITTPLYYANDIPHIGHAYCTIAVDAIARFHRSLGEEVYFITGSDEHGQKINRAAEEVGKQPIDHANEIVEYTKKLWDKLEINYDRFVRTTEKKHYSDVQKVIRTIFDNGEIYRDTYEGWYCTPCETFLTDEEVTDEKICPECGREVEWQKEDTYKFKLSDYTQTLIDLYEKEPWRMQPESRYNEIMSRLKKEGLRDLSITRTSLDWGVPLDEIEKGHVCYVWFDALLGYATAAGIFGDDNLPDGFFEKLWPNTVHIIGKDILWFHTVIYPAMQLAMGWDKSQISAGSFATGFWIEKGEKMSKSKGNIVDPVPLIEDFGLDAIRYFLLREITFGLDGSISLEAIINRTNSDLANDLGNLLHRSLSMLGKYRDGVIPAPDAIKVDVPLVTYNQLEEHFNAAAKGDKGFDCLRLPPNILIEFDENNIPKVNLSIEIADGVDEKYALWIERLIQQAFKSYLSVICNVFRFRLKEALIDIWDLIKLSNKYIDELQPWNLAKEEKNDILDSVFYYLLEAIRSSALMVSSFIPGISRNIYKQMGIERDVESELLENAVRIGADLLVPGTKTLPPKPVVPRIDMDEYLKAYESKKAKIVKKEKKAEKGTALNDDVKPVIQYDDFAKIDFRIAQIIEAEKIAGTDKLMKMQIDLGFEKRQIVGGIAQHYKAEDLVGRKIVVVANLAPIKLKGVDSNGMLLAATNGDDMFLLSAGNDASPGSKIS